MEEIGRSIAAMSSTMLSLLTCTLMHIFGIILDIRNLWARRTWTHTPTHTHPHHPSPTYTPKQNQLNKCDQMDAGQEQMGSHNHKSAEKTFKICLTLKYRELFHKLLTVFKEVKWEDHRVGIMCIRVSSPSSNPPPPPLSCQPAPLKSANCPSPLFRQSPLYIGFLWIPPKC